MKLPRLLKRRVLVLIPQVGMTGTADFIEIGKRIMKKRPKIGVFVYGADRYDQFKWRHKFRPTLTVCMGHEPDIKVPRGTFLHGDQCDKVDEYHHLETAGIIVPKWTTLQPNTSYDPDEWGKYVIVKPAEGYRGKDVVFKKTTRLHYKPEKHADEKWIVQEFIYTGEHPTNYRATTLLGKTMWVTKSTNTHSGPPLTDPNQLTGQSPVGNSAMGTTTLCQEQDVIEFADYIAQTAYPDVPVLGIDIIRCALTNKLYCCETNPFGYTWHYSSPSGKAIERQNNFSFKNDTNGFEIAVDTLIDATERLAK